MPACLGDCCSGRKLPCYRRQSLTKKLHRYLVTPPISDIFTRKDFCIFEFHRPPKHVLNMDTPHQQEFQIRDLGTRSVTLFPARAQVVREINARLKPGANQITVHGLSPSVDEQSVKVEGTGSAIITDIAVESLPNREIFQDIYPDSESSDSEPESEGDDDEASNGDDQVIVAIKNKITTLLDEQKRAKELIASAESRLQILDAYGKMMTGKDIDPSVIDIAGNLGTYTSERAKLYEDSHKGAVQEREASQQIGDLKKEEAKLRKTAHKEREKIKRAKAKARRIKEKGEQKEARKMDKIVKEKARIRRERESFWPKNVYTIKVSLEATSFTPATSRRGSVSSDLVQLATETAGQAVEDEATGLCNLTLTYVTSYAYWSPSYDLALSTTTNSGTLLFDAQLANATSETWKNCKIILSTSHADFSGLNDKIPSLVPWRIRLASKGPSSPPANPFNEVTYSSEEQSQKASWTASQYPRTYQKPRSQLFGLDNGSPFVVFPGKPAAAEFGPYKANAKSGLFGNANNANNNIDSRRGFGSATANMKKSGALFAMAASKNNTGEGLSGSTAQAATAPPPGALWGNANSSVERSEPTKNIQIDDRFKSDLSSEELRYMHGNGAGADASTIVEEQPELAFQESSFEETGFTSTFELPGLKTLTPSLTTSKQRVTKVSFASAAFSHTVVAKYKPAAYLKARLRNGSKLTLLKGPTGLTLDGSFMGRTTLPRCSPGDAFSLSLGIDPAIRVAYPKPDVKRSQSGLFSKEDSSVYTRVITLSSTRSGEKVKPASITVMDQIPISEDEKLRIEIIRPRGLVLGGAEVVTGAPGREGKDQKDWGTALAQLKKGGEVSWEVKLNAGRMVKLAMEYECAFPAGEHAVNASGAETR